MRLIPFKSVGWGDYGKRMVGKLKYPILTSPEMHQWRNEASLIFPKKHPNYNPRKLPNVFYGDGLLKSQWIIEIEYMPKFVCLN